MSESAYWWEAGEELFARENARRAGTLGECRQHNWRPDGHGGGTCPDCGATVSAGEL